MAIRIYTVLVLCDILCDSIMIIIIIMPCDPNLLFIESLYSLSKLQFLFVKVQSLGACS